MPRRRRRPDVLYLSGQLALFDRPAKEPAPRRRRKRSMPELLGSDPPHAVLPLNRSLFFPWLRPFLRPVTPDQWTQARAEGFVHLHAPARPAADELAADARLTRSL